MRSRVLAQALTSAAVAAAISTLAACGGATADSASGGPKPAAAAQSGPHLKSAHRAHRARHHGGAPAVPSPGAAASPAPAKPGTHTAAKHTPAKTGRQQGAQQKPQSQSAPAAGAVRFGAVTVEDSNSTIDVSSDGLALTALFADLEAKSDDGVPSNGTRMAMPLTGGAPSATITVEVSGYAFARHATARLIVTLNGKPVVREFPSGTDRDFVEPIALPAIGGSTYQLSVAVDEQPSSRRGAAYINISSVDAEIT